MRFIKPVMASLLAFVPFCSAAQAQSVLMSSSNTVEMPPVTVPAKVETTKGTPCKTNCGSEADGYEWASDTGIASPAKCPEGSEDFVKGCKRFAEELIRQSINLERAEQGLPPLPEAEPEQAAPAPPIAEAPAPPPTEATPPKEKPVPLPPVEPPISGYKPHESTLLVSPVLPPSDITPVEEAPDEALANLPPAELPTMKRQDDGQPIGSSLSIGRVP